MLPGLEKVLVPVGAVLTTALADGTEAVRGAGKQGQNHQKQPAGSCSRDRKAAVSQSQHIRLDGLHQSASSEEEEVKSLNLGEKQEVESHHLNLERGAGGACACVCVCVRRVASILMRPYIPQQYLVMGRVGGAGGCVKVTAVIRLSYGSNQQRLPSVKLHSNIANGRYGNCSTLNFQGPPRHVPPGIYDNVLVYGFSVFSVFSFIPSHTSDLSHFHNCV